MEYSLDETIKIRSYNKDGHHAHVWQNRFKNLLLWNQKANDPMPWYITLVNVYVDLLVFTRIAGTS